MSNAALMKTPVQKTICEKGGLNILIKIAKIHRDKLDVIVPACGAIRSILSSNETHSKYCTPEVLDTVKECLENNRDSARINEFYLVLTRKEDQRVRDAVSRGECTGDLCKRITETCDCNGRVYCPKCVVLQKMFKCNTCDKGKMMFYCETCWRKDHQGHDCEEFFCTQSCDTKSLSNK